MKHSSRRTFLRRSVVTVGLSAAAPLFLRRLAAADETSNDSILVVLELAGGNDGLSMIVPADREALEKARPNLAVPEADVLPLTDEIGLNPALRGLAMAYVEGRLAIVQGTGYPDPNRSHFKSMDIWHTADPAGRRRETGWLGRAVDRIPGAAEAPCLSVHVGSRPPYSLRADRRPAVSFDRPERFSWNGPAGDTTFADLNEPAAGDEGPSAFLHRVAADARAASARVAEATSRYRTSIEYPATRLAGDLRTVAGLIDGDVGGRVYSVRLGGFDTHTNQATTYAERMAELDGALVAFLADLESKGHDRRVAVLAFSEFGRRVAENASGGTDHGAAGPMLLIGRPVAGGVHGRHPSLTDLDRGDLRWSTDFRRVYASAIEGHLGIDREAVLGPGFEPLPLF